MTKIKMKQNQYIVMYILLGIVLFGVVYIVTSIGRGKMNSGTSINKQVTSKNCVAESCLSVQNLTYPVGDLSIEAQNALKLALEDEFKAYTTYQRIIDTFGLVRPFSMIIRAEESHIASIKALFDKYGLQIPANPWINKISVPATVQQACQIGVDAEIANAALYKETLLPQVSAYEDITQVFTSLMSASEQNHLPAFNRCK